MSIRKMVNINEELCDGCGLCVPACAEGAIQVIDGKARLVSDVYCDGLGACLGECPQGAIMIEEREAADFDEDAVKVHLKRLQKEAAATPARETTVPFAKPHAVSSPFAAPACPGSAARHFDRAPASRGTCDKPAGRSQLGHWPVQLMLVPPHAPFLKNQDILVCADCVPFSIPDFHERYLAGRAVVVGCPKLDDLSFYFEKLKAIFAEAKPRRITVLRMEVPCCGGIAQAALSARNETAPEVPFEIHTIGIRGEIHAETAPAGRAAG